MFLNLSFGKIDLVQLDFHMRIDIVTKGSIGFILSGLKICFIETAIIADLSAFLLYFGADEFTLPGKLWISIPIIKPLSMFLLLLFSLKVLVSQPLFMEYMQYKPGKNDFIEKNYVWPKKDLISIPEKKKNLVFVILESFESSLSSKEEGGLFYSDHISELTKIAKENIHFSNSYKLGGGYNAATASYTVGSYFAMLTGLPLKDITNYNKGFVPNAYSSLDFLSEIGYKNYFFSTCLNNSLYKLDLLFKTHGNATIYVAEDYWNLYPQFNNDETEWGTYDHVTFHAVKELLRKVEEPFTITIGTMDTHFPFGKVCKKCKDNNNGFRYLDIYECISKQVKDLIEFTKTLPIYNDTVFVIVGDHLTMSYEIGEVIKHNDKYYKRRIYNAIVNSPLGVISDKITKKRLFNAFDWFPTVLAAMGFKIKGERLGLGTNLFSGMKTLSEKYGKNYFNKQILEPTNFIKDKILLNQDDDINIYIKTQWEPMK